MSKKLPPEGKRFQKGQSGNPGGKAKVPDDIKRARTLNQIELERVVNRYLYLTSHELRERIQDPTTPMMEMMVASIIAQAAQKGDQQRLEFILCRLIGKVKDQLEITGVKPFIVEKIGGGRVEMGVEEQEKA